MVGITQGDAHDIASIMPVMQDAFDPAYGESWTASQCLGTLTMPNTRLILARNKDSNAKNSTVGFAMTRWVLDEEELLMIAVLPQNQREGIAGHLIDYVIKNGSLQTRKFLFLEVRDGNSAYFFYENRGFVETGRRKSYYLGNDGQRRDAITMSLQV
jgi:[ribosomal protein S18]-alanine N-acetyltransferase